MAQINSEQETADPLDKLVTLMRSPRWAAIKQRLGGILAVPVEQRDAFEEMFGKQLVAVRGMSEEDLRLIPECVAENLRTGKIHPKLPVASEEMLDGIEFQ